MTASKRHFLRHTAAALVSLTLGASAFAQAFPTKPVTLMVPYPAGGCLT
ncbi:MAG: hypothetical protein ACK5RC_11595 [Curvibacter sp.]|jgi:tripartite-type tricarboxylate transporter receptor subunit TctC